jgi:hypothetical protein
VTDFWVGGTVEAFTKRIQAARKAQRDATVKGLRAATRVVQDASNAQAPKEDGDFIRGSRTSVDNDALAGAVSYRDTAFRGQAAKLHEDMNMRHDSGRSAKFLERAFASTRGTVLQIIGKNVRDGMGS